ncbi:leucine-rich repeat domain-containing protein [Mycoplasmopsis arginini]|uniref:Leucine-rich repeat domain-containing protein n=1 Tax=Mycoplasmopsis arginini TaxID=2094 RepID=A0ABZ2AIC4_MYCAR|nr:leucine-rich repeat domain-containing protein [Mycoplasmopsis arginini]WVN21871.1 leucine-rich repeat domain-containing protein [Mycoplasmopsis arginini]VEU81885.1 hypothetical lipoprotein [Mycoplasmopsis arginini]
MKTTKKLLLTLTGFALPVISASLVVSCGSKETLNEFAKDFVLGAAGRDNYNKDTKTLDLSKTNLEIIPAGAFSAQALHGLFLNTSEQANVAPEFAYAPGIFNVKENKINIDKIILPGTLKVIEKGAFEGLGLKEIEFDISSSNLTKIEEDAFKDNKLKTIVLPSSITEIKERAFYNNQITSINLEVATNLKRLSGGVLAKNQLTNINLVNINTIDQSALALNKFTSLELHQDLSRVSERLFWFVGEVEVVNVVNLTVQNAELKTLLKEALTKNEKLYYTIND